MEINYSLASLLLFLSSLFIVIKQWRTKKPKKLPPGPWKLPIIGSLHHLIGRGLPHRVLRDLSQRYGPIMYLQMGQVPTVVISSPTMAKQVLKTHDLAFVNRPQLTSTSIIFYNNKDIAFSQYGDYWRQMRKICTLELLSTKMVKSYGAIREDELSSLISSIRSTMGNTINMTQIIFLFSNSIICRSAFGKICKNREEFLTILKEVLLLGAGFFVGDLFPSWRLIHNLRGEKTRMVNAHNKVDVVMEEILNEHIENKAAGKMGNGEFGDEDLVDVFLRVKENAELQFPIANENIKAVIFATIIDSLSEVKKKLNQDSMVRLSAKKLEMMKDYRWMGLDR
uniref:Cytochrome P450 n=1 Tax=Solanum lycopersicum TaxID=4081 RepID=A0A3Q7HQ86_SOLLC